MDSAGTVGLTKLLKKFGLEVNRENYIWAAWGNEPPSPWTAEDETRLPEALQNWDKFEDKGGEAVYIGDYDPNQPRAPAGTDIGGQWVGEGGGERPKVTGDGKNVDKVQHAINSLPQEHIDRIGDKLKSVTNVDVIQTREPGFYPMGLARYQGDNNIFIQVADRIPVTGGLADILGGDGAFIRNLDIEGVTVHEMGHALDVATGRKWNPSVAEQVWKEAYDPFIGMSSDELKRSAHYLSSESEMFAELYRTIYSRARNGGFGMPQDRADQVFKKSIKHMKELLP